MPDAGNSYGLLTPVLRACLLPDEHTSGQGDPRQAAVPLVAWLEAQLKVTGQKYHLTSEIALDRLREAAKELTAQIAEPFKPELEAAYRYLLFVEHVLCEPPTVVRVLAHRFSVEESQIERWVGEQCSSPELARVAEVLLDRLIDLCKEPERPERDLPQGLLERFDQLTYLGGLRSVFGTLYGRNPPKLAQATYLPPLLACLDRCFHDEGKGRAVLIAPTNGGKNGIILAAALAAIAWDKGPVIVLQPFRAQIAESSRTWTAAVAGRPVYRIRSEIVRSISVAGSSALIADNDPLIVRGRIDVTAIIPEKLAVLARQRPLSAFCGLLIADEIGLLFDKERGAKLEILLTLARLAGLPILAVGAAVSEEASASVARWLADLQTGEDPRQAGVLLHDPTLKRDPPIEIWVWRRDGQQRFWREGMTPLDPNKSSTDPLPSERDDAVCELILRELRAAPARQILVFLENRQLVVDLADSLARSIAGDDVLRRKLNNEANDLAQGSPLEEIWLGGALPFPADVPSILKQRVGVHTRDVPSNNIERIEQAFRDGRLRVLFATTTVEAGINLPVDTVVQVGLVDHNGRRLDQRSLEQRLGRSGRTIEGVGAEGRGIVYVHNVGDGIDRVIHERILNQEVTSDSQLGQPERALLVLAYLRSAEDRTDQDIKSVLGASYWAAGRHEHAIAAEADQALKDLRQFRLVEEDSSPDGVSRGWIITPLGRAVASALLLPSDARAVEHIVEVAKNELSGEAWLAEVLYAACCVPSISQGNRRPRSGDIVVRRPMTRDSVLRSWTRLLGGERVGFALPRRKTRMVGGLLLTDLLQRVEKGSAKRDETTALIRAYTAWLWARGEEISSVEPYLRNLNEHVVQQDLGYYLSHVLRAAGWLAQHENQFLLGRRLWELSREVDLGVPIHLIDFYETCMEHIKRQDVMSVKLDELESLLDSLEGAVSEDLRGRLLKKREDRFKFAKALALEVGVVEHEGQLVRFERMDTAEKLAGLLQAVWDSEGPQPVQIDANNVRCVDYIVMFSYEDVPQAQSECDLLVSGRLLAGHLREDRSYKGCSILGAEEFVALVLALQGRESVEQELVLAILAEVGGICQPSLIEAIGAEVAASRISRETFNETLAKSRQQLWKFRSEWRPTGHLPLEFSEDSVAPPEILEARAQLLDGMTLLGSLVGDRVRERERALIGTSRAPQIQLELGRWRVRRRKVNSLRERISIGGSEVELNRLCSELNRYGEAWFESGLWDRIDLRM